MGKILLCTGASSEIGQKLIKKINRNYDCIWAHYHGSKNAIEHLQRESGGIIRPIQVDFSNEENIRSMAEKIALSGKIPDHIIHLSAPKAFNLQFHKCKWEYFQEEMDISFQSIVILLNELIPNMIKNKYGKIIFMLSSYVIGVPPKFQSPYITSKYALLGLMKCLASEYAGKGITVNAISPDMMETKFLSNIPEIIIQKNAALHPLGRNIYADEVIPAFEYLLSDGADIVTGQNIGITGGVELR